MSRRVPRPRRTGAQTHEPPNMRASPGVSVVIPTHNRAGLIMAAVESALAQCWQPLEVIVVDDGSTDDTGARLRAISAQDSRVRSIRRDVQGGVSAARNDGIREARFPYVALLDSDDRFAPEKLATQMPSLLAHPLGPVAFTGYGLVSNGHETEVLLDGWSSEPQAALDRLLAGCCVGASTLVAPRTTLLHAGLFRTTLACCEDHDLWLRLAVLGYPFLYERRVLTRLGPQSTGLSANEGRVAHFSEVVINDLLGRPDLPIEVARRRALYRARWALSSAGRYISVGDGKASLRALARAARARPLSIRPGWLRLAFRAVRISHAGVTRSLT